jgi:hypothetical protein
MIVGGIGQMVSLSPENVNNKRGPSGTPFAFSLSRCEKLNDPINIATISVE